MTHQTMRPTERTLRELRKNGFRCAIVERWNQYGGPLISPKCPICGQGPKHRGVRNDLFEIIDVVALSSAGIVGIQCCSGSGYQAHIRKMTIEKAGESVDWLKTPGCTLELWAWRRVKVKRGGKAEHWKPRIRIITIEDVK